MILLVCGGRDYADRKTLEKTLDRVHEKRVIDILIHGDCKTGADAMAQSWADSRGIHTARIAALWNHFPGNSAGPLRNVRMALLLKDRPGSGVLAFPGGRGTENMVKNAKAMDIPVMEIT